MRSLQVIRKIKDSNESRQMPLMVLKHQIYDLKPFSLVLDEQAIKKNRFVKEWKKKQLS